MCSWYFGFNLVVEAYRRPGFLKHFLVSYYRNMKKSESILNCISENGAFIGSDFFKPIVDILQNFTLFSVLHQNA